MRPDRPHGATLAGSVAIVTGAGQGMGRAIALALSDHGAAVVAVDQNGRTAAAVCDEIARRGGRSTALAGDVRDASTASASVQQALADHGTVDILVNNAGVLRPGPLERITEEEWDLVVDVTLKGAFLMTRAVVPVFKAQRRGKIVNLASLAGRATSTLGGPHYTAAKAGMLGLSRHSARELAPYGVNVNAICPGIIDTPMAHSLMDAERLEAIRQSIPFKRLGAPEEVAELVLFLVRQESSYITGAAIDIHGGELII